MPYYKNYFRKILNELINEKHKVMLPTRFYLHDKEDLKRNRRNPTQNEKITRKYELAVRESSDMLTNFITEKQYATNTFCNKQKMNLNYFNPNKL